MVRLACIVGCIAVAACAAGLTAYLLSTDHLVSFLIGIPFGLLGAVSGTALADALDAR